MYDAASFVCFHWSLFCDVDLFVSFDSLRPSQQSFSYVGTGLPGSNQYLARINMSC